MIELFLSAKSLPFSVALAVVSGLFLLEIASLIMGGTVMGIGGGDADIDIEADFDISADVDIDAPGLDLEAIDGAGTGLASPSGFFGWTGIQSVPFLIWLVSFLTLFGLSGLIIQSTCLWSVRWRPARAHRVGFGTGSCIWPNADDRQWHQYDYA
jgi:hypothetical protein